MKGEVASVMFISLYPEKRCRFYLVHIEMQPTAEEGAAFSIYRGYESSALSR